MTENAYHGMHQDEANRLRALRKQEERHAADRARFLSNLAALCPATTVPDPEFPGCTWDAAPYPYLGEAA